MNTEQDTAWLASNALRLVAIAGAGYKLSGRGMIMAGFKEDDRDHASYVDLKTARACGYSEDFIRAIEAYDPAMEAIIFLNCGDRGRLLRFSLESGDAQYVSLN